MFFSLATVNLLGIHVVAQGLIYLSHEDLKALLQRRCQGCHFAEGARAVASLSLVSGSPFKALMTWMIWGTPILGSLHLEISMVTQKKIVNN